ncbi:MAG: GNAT family N-acetyltransferase [Antricoccus sp.]
MSLFGAHLRRATAADCDSVMQLTAATMQEKSAQAQSGVRRIFDDVGLRGHEEHFGRLCSDENIRVAVVASDADDSQLFGVAVMTFDVVTAVFDAPAVNVNYLLVPKAHAGRGVAKALLADAVRYADECGAKNIVVGVSSTDRDVNRFYARLGFAPLTVRRIASVAHIRKTLSRNGLGERVPRPTRTGRRLLLNPSLAGMSRIPRSR